eukprot:TRINITY_DN262_c0_g1_i3.p2 TRINITY_DN262_c0_g1~~TRINITY_DN262_c0_g1_i3.p2  ORF type:complete len:290 (+),score=103.73 TRINITY_DN262_c0_g1_i3:56-925(+)
MNMMTVAVFLCTAALATGLSSAPDAAPADSPADMEPPVDLVPTVDCKTDIECRMTDGAAKCVDGQCDCSNGDKTRFCTGKLKGLVSFTIAFVFSGADCRVFKSDVTAETKLHAALLNHAVFKLTGYNILCGSVVMVASMEASVEKLDAALAAATDGVVKAQASIPSIANATLSTSVVVGKGQPCSVTNAASTVLIEDKICYPTCNTGYERVEVSNVNATAEYECHKPSSDDDDMTPSVIAAIVIGTVMSVAVIGSVIYYCFATPSYKAVNNEPFGHEGEKKETPQDITV